MIMLLFEETEDNNKIFGLNVINYMKVRTDEEEHIYSSMQNTSTLWIYNIVIEVKYVLDVQVIMIPKTAIAHLSACANFGGAQPVI